MFCRGFGGKGMYFGVMILFFLEKKDSVQGYIQEQSFIDMQPGKA